MAMQKIGGYAFLLGVIIALIAGLLVSIIPVNTQALILLIMVVLGVIIGLLNITDKETMPFLVAAIALILTKTALATLGVTELTAIVSNIAAMAAPAALIVALVAVFKMAKA